MFFLKWDYFFFFRQRSISDWDIPLYFPISSSLCWGGAQHYAFLLWATTAVSFTMNKFFKVVDVKREAAVILYVYCMYLLMYILCGAKLKIRRTLTWGHQKLTSSKKQHVLILWKITSIYRTSDYWVFGRSIATQLLIVVFQFLPQLL